MEKLQTLLWIVLGLGVFIWRMVQKARATTTREQQQRPPRTRQAPPLPAASFEELLKQMQAGNRTTTAAPAAAEPTTPAGRPLPREKATPARSLEQRATAAASLETSTEARSLEVPLHEARRAASQPRASRRPNEPADYWARQQARAQEPARATVTDLLRNPADLRAAFMLSEILQRRF
ncbi:hypothetical protein [Hymenobacter canadensis]|uniref:Uncharacterized protein n=1 Tax=Hymenobacter canadensis TaxID=2999067 RepID=A0ABY7LSA3_9BACT|nr:hypothetical protein [Hymenobacter canadensis]WBA43295.1 hypothetical protein O3303_06930 [Hymenobacter canadensis]